MLNENKRISDFTGVAKFHEAGYFGSRVFAATGEAQYIGKAEAHGYKYIRPITWYSTGDDWHGTETAFIFWEVAPQATLVTIPDAKCKINGIDYDFNIDGLALADKYGITLMYLSMLNNTDCSIRDTALDKHPNFFYITGTGNNEPVGSFNQLTLCKNIYGVGAYYLADDGTITIPDYDSDAVDNADFAAPARVYYDIFGTPSPFDGVSCSDPYLVGMCALVQDFFIDKTGKPLTREMMYQFLKDNSFDCCTVGKDTKTGWGYVVLPDPTTIDIVKYQPSYQPNVPKPTYTVQMGAFSQYQNCVSLKIKINALPDTIGAGYSKAFIKQVDNVFKLQVGIFSIKANAQKVVDDLKAKGYSAFITTR